MGIPLSRANKYIYANITLIIIMKQKKIIRNKAERLKNDSELRYLVGARQDKHAICLRVDLFLWQTNICMQILFFQ